MSSKARHWLVPVLCGLAALLPWLLLRYDFAQLFWFGDEWHLLLEIRELGFWPWLTKPFAENFCPLFKLLWGGAALISRGSYRFMIGLDWMTHSLNVVLLGILLLKAGWSRTASAIAMLLFGLAFSNLETLGWSVQWSAVLAFTFFLAAAICLLHAVETWSTATIIAVGFLVLASALSFSRGVVTGFALAAFAVLPSGSLTFARRLAIFAVTSLPAALVVLVTMATVHPSTGGFIPASLEARDAALHFLANFLFLNPVAYLVRATSHTEKLVILVFKVAVWIAAFRLSGARVRSLLAMLLVFDLGNSALVALGRWWTTPPMAQSSRYQYGSLICFTPFVALLFDWALARRVLWATWAARALAAVSIIAVVRPWPAEVRGWAQWRGAATRRILAERDPAKEGSPPQIPPLWESSARALVSRFNLH